MTWVSLSLSLSPPHELALINDFYHPDPLVFSLENCSFVSSFFCVNFLSRSLVVDSREKLLNMFSSFTSAVLVSAGIELIIHMLSVYISLSSMQLAQVDVQPNILLNNQSVLTIKQAKTQFERYNDL